LFHDAGGDRSQTVEALRRILPRLKEQDYSFGFPVR
ncbi:polysaccharide deacetylase family protein, partial [Streptomyces sp. SID2888]|nr:polysaccharide deacetylase family protein [Streptomyces sp. SID2888]